MIAADPWVIPSNDYATLDFSKRFQTIDDGTSLLQPGYYMAKIDLKSAYRRLVSISEESQQFPGLQFVLNNQVVYLRECSVILSCPLVQDWHLVYFTA